MQIGVMGEGLHVAGDTLQHSQAFFVEAGAASAIELEASGHFCIQGRHVAGLPRAQQSPGLQVYGRISR